MRRGESDKARQDERHYDCGHCKGEESEIKGLFVPENVHHFG